MLQVEINQLNEKIREACPDDVLSESGILLLRTPKSADTLVRSTTPSPLTVDKYERPANKPYYRTDLGVINSKGLLQIEDFTRPLYPWETVHGMKWLKTL